MELRVTKLKGDFNNIISVRNNVKSVFDILQVRIDKLRQIYSEFIDSNKNEMFVFGLDSFHFQSKLIDIEYDDMKRLFLAINNRMYCEYFKLHKIIVEYISKTINDKQAIDLVKINNYPIYKDLEPFKEYKFETILDIHENILNLLGVIISILNNKENELSIHKTKQNIGLNIDNFITTFNFNLSVMREKITMFIAYVEFFHKMHSKYIKRFSNKIQLMYTHINNDIKFDDSIEISKNKKQELIDEFVSNHVDKKLLKELKTSIGSETNSEEDSSESDVRLNTPINISTNREEITFEDIHSLPNTRENINNSASIFELPQKDIEKRNLKKIFQTNVHKVSNTLNLLKFKNNPKTDNIIDSKISNTDLDKIFSGINKSCDSIINDQSNINTDKNDTVIKELDAMPYLQIESENYNQETESILNLNTDSTNDHLFNPFENLNVNLISGNISKELIINEIEKYPDTNNEVLEDLTEEENDIKEDIMEVKEDIIEEKNDVIEEKKDIIGEKEDVIEEPIKQTDINKKKKRNYNKKKK